MCYDSNIINGDIMNGEGVLACYHGCSGSIVNPMAYYCTDYSLDENWSAGQRSIAYTFIPTSDNVFQFGYSSCCWINTLVVGSSSSWILLATANLSVRQDTGKINTSPISAMQPIVRLKYGCSYSLRIPVEDDDGDTVKCRWAKNSQSDECSNVCEAFPGAASCILSYTASRSTGWHAVALQIEDYSVSDTTTPLSSVPLQFLVDISSTTDSCDDKPLVLNLTNVNGSVATIALNTTFFQTIVANSGSTNVSITEIVTVSPVGMIKTGLLSYGSSGTQWYVNVTWTPSLSQAGSHIFCYTAVNSMGQSSDQACVTIKVDAFVTFQTEHVLGVNECTSSPCHNEGVCTDDISRYTCTCPVSHTGKNCETDINFCEGVTCGNGGTCVDGVLNYTCTCPGSHTGGHCEADINFCEGVMCGNGGTCVDGVFDYSCTCPVSHTGSDCETDINFCEGVTCGNGGTCVDGVLNYTCTCPGSHTGGHCEADINFCEGVVCGNGGTCVDGVFDYSCTCPVSHTGSDCETDINFCEGVTCGNGGTCVDGVLNYTCTCPGSHTGGHCEADINFCEGVMCGNGGTCVDGVFDYSCTCPVSHTGSDCETDINFCEGVTCGNGGTCVDGVLNYTCTCPGSHTGGHCEADINFCEGVTCGNGGTCVDGVLNYTCTCPGSHTGVHCEADVDFCLGVTCQNEGTCVDGVLDYTCTCPSSHTGDHCEIDVDFCLGVTCQNEGTCVDGVLDYTCTCPSSHTGDHCEIDVDFCLGVTCQNEGTCVDGVLDYTCTCPSSHTGDHCEIVATCSLHHYSHTGDHCEIDIDFCDGVICENNGSCVDGVFNYTCICPVSHTGFHCESVYMLYQMIVYSQTSLCYIPDIDFCKFEDLPCRNGGTCVDGLFDYTCTCPLTHTGDHCQTEADNTGYVLSVVFVSIGLVLSGILTGVLIKTSVSFIKGPGSSIDTYNPLYM
ncbi:Delta-like protein D,Fibropellin-3,Protein eyes shut,Sushi, von Willebrand factor type A, EGF and pentraxin domain-containing protein 1,Delta-like protein C,Fibropellin-1,Protein crumbs homolog 1 [Mytilus coruscus]|uniref:Delta-like protein D,Fibropellin-3,Protein eyes shut,Sushi, von Willebrand factor type A, EGF and pentraxin domain-containing protein 1,Delta-like protein C,Fibropellin-1,Protein crumbs homolog 1 n=1 Tax=Mytilus coruscus TaxID=42192 RepID=A0A6J8CZC5_MYTCO|nr:Delta-like protein D,Fibropellin-3,Protein eyes shut,Sushi, von Willebrand factor type A, EGF and pentraxin domain-containing protein 1,Delta-like protein C,Fibropellin-1,Protein crumbs homolog 1 [Mytilus coruscus]